MIFLKRIKKCVVNNSAGILCAFCLLLIFALTPSYTSEGTYDGIQLCLNIAIPSLFPMMFAAVFVIETGLAEIIGNKLSCITTRFFDLPGTAGAALLLAVIGGFPAGAKAVCELHSRGEVGQKDAERMLLFCFSAGPAFLLGTVGGLYGDIYVGVLLIIVQIISIVTIGFFTRFLPRNSDKEKVFRGKHNSSCIPKSVASSLTSAARKTSAAMLNICLFIVIFSVLRSIIDNCGISSAFVNFLSLLGVDKIKAEAIIPVILEVTSGCVYASDVGIPMTAFAVGFGGLAVHMQILAISQKLDINYPLFFCARLIQGLLCAALSFAALKIIPSEVIDVVSFTNLKPTFSTAPTGAVMLIIMSFMCVLCIPETEEKQA